MNSLSPDRLLNLAVMVVLVSFVYFFAVTFVPIPETGEDNAKYIVGFLVGTGVGSIITFYFRKSSPDTPQTDKNIDDKQILK